VIVLTNGDPQTSVTFAVAARLFEEAAQR
jgi:hypothetical protein